MKQSSSTLSLTITPIDDKTACLVKVTGVTNQNTVYTNMGKYEGHNYYDTDESLEIVVGEFNGQTYTITAINECSFSHCKNLKVIFLGKEISRIEWNMYQCNSLQNIKVHKDNPTYFDNDGVLFKRDKQGYELVAFPQGRKGQYIVPNGTRRLGNCSFKSCQINDIILPESLVEIGINVFYECKNLTEIILPSSLRKVSSNEDVGHKPIKQKFYLADDTNRTNPLTIEEVRKIFPE